MSFCMKQQFVSKRLSTTTVSSLYTSRLWVLYQSSSKLEVLFFVPLQHKQLIFSLLDFDLYFGIYLFICLLSILFYFVNFDNFVRLM